MMAVTKARTFPVQRDPEVPSSPAHALAAGLLQGADTLSGRAIKAFTFPWETDETKAETE